jgi:hypothetical protein
MVEPASVKDRYKNKTSTETSTELVDKASSEAKNAGAPPTNTGSSGKLGLDGRPIGSPIYGGTSTSRPPETSTGRPVPGAFITKKTQYFKGAGMTFLQTLNNKQRIAILEKIAQIPGAYSNEKDRPTASYLQSLVASGMINVRPEDAAAVEKLMYISDTVGEDISDTINRFYADPKLAKQTLDISGLVGKKISLTPADALIVELQQSVLDYLDIKASKSEAESYAKKINDLEKKRKGPLTQLERQQLLLDEVQNKAKEVFKDGIDEADSLLMRKGALGGTYNALQQEYRDYGIPIDDKSLYKLAINSIRSKQALENNLSKVRLQAEVAMPAIKDYIKQGLSPKEALGTYVAAYSKFTGIPQNQVDLTRLAPVYSGDKVMPFNDWEKYLYTLPEAKDSPIVKEQKLNDSRVLIRNFIG